MDKRSYRVNLAISLESCSKNELFIPQGSAKAYPASEKLICHGNVNKNNHIKMSVHVL